MTTHAPAIIRAILAAATLLALAYPLGWLPWGIVWWGEMAIFATAGILGRIMRWQERRESERDVLARQTALACQLSLLALPAPADDADYPFAERILHREPCIWCLHPVDRYEVATSRIGPQLSGWELDDAECPECGMIVPGKATWQQATRLKREYRLQEVWSDDPW